MDRSRQHQEWLGTEQSLLGPFVKDHPHLHINNIAGIKLVGYMNRVGNHATNFFMITSRYFVSSPMETPACDPTRLISV